MLSCCRPGVRQFLAALRVLGTVRLITHARQEYADALNRVFRLGFSKEQIFARRGLKIPERIIPVILIDDEAKTAFDFEALQRHREKCHMLGITPGSSWDVPVTAFLGMKNDPFSKPHFWRSLVDRVARVSRRSQIKPLPPKQEISPPISDKDVNWKESLARLERSCGPCLSVSEVARRLGIARSTVIRWYFRDRLIAFPVAFKMRRRFPIWQFGAGKAKLQPWIYDVVQAFGSNSWLLVDFLTKPGIGNSTHLVQLRAGAVVDVIEAAREARSAQIGGRKAHCHGNWPWDR